MFQTRQRTELGTAIARCWAVEITKGSRVLLLLGVMLAISAIVHARRVTCPQCDGTGRIEGPVLNGLQSYYGCPRCGGRGGGGEEGHAGRGWIEVPDDAPPVRQPDPEAVRLKKEEAARQVAEAARISEAEQRRKDEVFQKKAEEVIRSMKGIQRDDLGLKGADDRGVLGLKGIGGSAPAASTGWTIYYPAMQNNSYQKGYDALRKRDPAGAAVFFAQAQRELPNDAMVQDALVGRFINTLT